MMIIKGSFQLSSALHVGGVDTDCCYYFYIQSNGSFGYVLDSKLEVVGCSRIEGGKAWDHEPADLGPSPSYSRPHWP